jgi:hypothetical protein
MVALTHAWICPNCTKKNFELCRHEKCLYLIKAVCEGCAKRFFLEMDVSPRTTLYKIEEICIGESK